MISAKSVTSGFSVAYPLLYCPFLILSKSLNIANYMSNYVLLKHTTNSLFDDIL